MKKYFFIVIIASIFFACDKNEGLINSNNFYLQTGANSFTYNQYFPFQDKAIEVYYYIPENADITLPILFSLHGMNRNGYNHRNSLINKADEHGFILVVPEFNDDNFPGGDAYNLANIFVDGDNPSSGTLNPREQWTFSVLDPLFIYFKTLITNYSDKYNLIGFSAGGQLAHRTFIYSNTNYCNKTIAMGSGWYTTINENLDFPYGLNGSPYDSSLTSIFSKDLTILVGENDNDPNDPNLRRNTIVDQQGDNRFDRAEYFFTNAESLAQQANLFFNWKKYIVPNAAHELSPNANFALDLIYNDK